jgi:hypothetical protein
MIFFAFLSLLLSNPVKSDWCNSKALVPNRRSQHGKTNSSSGPPSGPPRWEALTKDEQKYFTRCETIFVEKSMFIDDSGAETGGTFYSYDKTHINSLLKSAKLLVQLIKSQGVYEGTLIHSRKNRHRRPKSSEIWLLEALNDLQMGSKSTKVLVIGSQSPWYEVLSLAFGASLVHTVDYNRLSYDHPQLSTFTASEFWKSKSQHVNNAYDVILSISSYDHDGLGRYGDPIAPDGDLLSMSLLRTAPFFKDTTKLVLTVPVGEDLVAWNLMRIYGNVRLPLLLKGYDVVNKYGYDEKKVFLKFGGNSNFRQSYEPVFVLKKGVLSKETKTKGKHNVDL